jgi:translation elongation factor EF-Ts
LRQEGKPEAMLDNIAKGKLARFFKDIISKIISKTAN